MVKQLNQKFHKCLEDCKKLNTPSVLEKVGATAEKILYNYAIEMVSHSILDTALRMSLNIRGVMEKH